VTEFCLLSTADHHTVCWKWEEKKISFFFRSTFWISFKDFLVLLNMTLTHLISEFFGFFYLPETHNIWEYQVLWTRITRKKKNFSVYKWSHKGTIICSFISVPILKVLYVCPVFRSNLVLFIFHSDVTAVFIFCCSASCFLYLWWKSIYYISFTADMLTSSNEELLLSEVSQ